MNESTCLLPDCNKPTHAKMYCYAHYMKLWRYGTATPEHPSRWIDLRGQRFTALVVQERHGMMWVCACDCGAMTEVRAGDLNNGNIISCGDRAIHVRRDDIEYKMAHDRVRADRGLVQAYACIDCSGQANHWSYNHDDPDEHLSQVERTVGIPYSTKPEHYSPRCVPCHKRFDLNHIHHTEVA